MPRFYSVFTVLVLYPEIGDLSRKKRGFCKNFIFRGAPPNRLCLPGKPAGTLAGGLKDIFQHQFIVGEAFHEIAREKVDVIEFGEIKNMRF